ncbi:MAG: glycosyltransferase [Gammaproteobacteria bacterium]
MIDRGVGRVADVQTIEVSDFGRLPDQPLVSVCMLSYNHERYIRQAIDGVISQQVDFPIELIIGEDCSIDRTPDITREYQKRHPELIRIVTSTQNVGSFRNSQRCIQLCKGRYVAFCEGDDFWHNPEKLMIQMEAMQSDPDITLCHTDYNRIIGRWSKHSYHTNRKTPGLDKQDTYVSFLHEGSVKTVTALFRKDVLDEFLLSPFNRADWPFGDYSKCLFSSVRGKVYYLPVSTATWRKVPGSATNAGRRAKLRMRLKLEECREMFMKNFPVDSEIERIVRAEGHRRIMGDAFAAGDAANYRKSWQWLRENGYDKNWLSNALRLAAIKARMPILLRNSIEAAFLAIMVGRKPHK